jgi:hypothetical protein
MSSIIKVDTIQTAAGGTPTAADLGLNVTGSVLQVVQGTYSTTTGNSTTSYADTGLSASITPTSSSSKILVVVDQQHYIARNTNVLNIAQVRLLRGSTVIYTHNRKGGIAAGTASNGYIELYTPVNISYLDSPATTSAVTYKTQNAAYTTSNSGTIGTQSNNQISTITLMEIAG